MTQVLEEFDIKYSKKEDQLASNKKQAKQLKHSCEQLHQTNDTLQKAIDEANNENKYNRERMQEQVEELNHKQNVEMQQSTRMKWMEREIKAKDGLIDEQKDIIQQLKVELEGIEQGQDQHRSMISRLKDKLKDNQSQMSDVHERRAKSREGREPMINYRDKKHTESIGFDDNSANTSM